jgi:hypothetical protein
MIVVRVLGDVFSTGRTPETTYTPRVGDDPDAGTFDDQLRRKARRRNGGVMQHRLWRGNGSGIGRRGRLTEPVTAFVGTVATALIQLKPFDPESKGIVERANKFLETSFMPGRRFRSPEDFNTQLADWLPVANSRLSAGSAVAQ